MVEKFRRPARLLVLAAALFGLGILAARLGSAALSGGSSRGLSTAPGTITLEEARNIQDYPVFWLGDNYAGYPLTAIDRATRPPTLAFDGKTPLSRAADQVYFIYGDCDIPPGSEGGCPPPIQLMSSHACLVPGFSQEALGSPARFARNGGKIQPMEQGHRRIWSGEAHVAVFDDPNALPADPEALLQQLKPLNATARAVVSAGWPAVASGPCPPALQMAPVILTPNPDLVPAPSN